MSFRPSPLAHAFAVAMAWAVLLGIACGRPEMFVLSLPLLVALLRGIARRPRTAISAAMTVTPERASEGEELTLTVRARIAPALGPVRMLLPRLPLLQPVGDPPALLPDADGGLAWQRRSRCQGSGVIDLGRVGFRAWDRSGCWVGEYLHTERLHAIVVPRPPRVRDPPVPRRSRVGSGAHGSPAAGEGVDFAEVRPFVAGDRLRAINWPASLRRQRLQANRFHPDRPADVILLIDTFTIVGRRPNSSLDHVLRATAGLALASLRRLDRVAILEYGGIARMVALGAGEGHYRRILDALSRAAPIRTEWLQDLRTLPERTLPRHALVLALTPLVDPRFERALCGLADRGHDIVVLALETTSLSTPLLTRRQRSKQVRRLWVIERDERLRALRGHAIRAVAWSPERPLEAALGAVRGLDRMRRPVWSA
ncbi:MAG: DUF58 domain-containing protein [Acetobacteraceae bacterium]